MSRCTGHCCRRFTVPMSPAAMLLTTVPDAPFIADMLVALPLEPGGPWYTCRHHDAVSGDCTVYDQRPKMCRDYPYGRPCAYKDCTAGSVPTSAGPQSTEGTQGGLVQIVLHRVHSDPEFLASPTFPTVPEDELRSPEYGVNGIPRELAQIDLSPRRPK